MASDRAGTFSVRCSCGTKLRLPVTGVGRRANCPKCQRAFRIPDPTGKKPAETGPRDTGDEIFGLSEEAGAAPGASANSCPHCGRIMGPSDVLCLGCGYSLATGQGVATGPSLTCPCCKTTLKPGVTICVTCGINAKTGRGILIVGGVDIDDAYDRTERILSPLSWFVPTGVYPIASEAFGTRKPIVTWTILAMTVVMSIWFWVSSATVSDPAEKKALLELMHWSGRAPTASEREDLARYWGVSSTGIPEYKSEQLLTSAFLHAGLLHLAGNMLFLVVLGGRVNAAIGNIGMSVLYVFFAVVSSMASMHGYADMHWHPSLGASGAVMGLAGMYLVLFPAHKLHMAFWWRFGFIGGFQLHTKLFAVRGFWAVLFYIAFDVIYVVLGWTDGVGHWTHLGGFVAGIAVATLFLATRLVCCSGTDLFSMVLGRWAWLLVGRPDRSPRGLPLP